MLSRRSLLGAAGVAAAAPFVLAAGPATAASPPRTRSAVRGESNGGVVTPSMALTHLTVSAGASVRLRTADGWQPWRPASGCPGCPDGMSGPTTALVPAAGVVEYQVTGDAVVTELNTGTARPAAARLPFSRTSRISRTSKYHPPYLSRAAWGADESYRYNPDGTLDTPPAFYPVQTLTVHHTGEDNPEPDPIKHIRGIYYNQAVGQDWGDIGYQLLIDAEGRVYEGTYSDDDVVPVFGPSLTPEGLPMMVNGSHVGGFNAGNIGVCLMGNFMTAPPTAAALRSLTIVLAVLAGATRLDPEGTTDYVNPVSGARATLRTISGHRDWHTANPNAGATLCPGDKLYPLLPQVRKDVAALTRLLP